jgi:RNA polymerase sigma-70 factor (ECF subfamily)
MRPNDDYWNEVAVADGELMRRAQAGEDGAFEVLFERHRDKTFTIALSILGDAAEAADVVQETFLKAYRKLHRFREDGAIKSYLYRTARNAAIDALRKRRTDSTPLEHADGGERVLLDPTDRPDQTFQKKTNLIELNKALNSLSEEHRVVVVMHHLEELTVEQIAEELQIPVGTVKSRLGRAREILRRKLLGTVDLD